MSRPGDDGGVDCPSVVNDVATLIAADGVELALHRWIRPGNEAVLCYVHGIQSHAGWLFETGPRLAAGGVDVYALDRRGSGRSGGVRGHLPSVEAVLDDYALALDHVATTTGRQTVALGQSLGGGVLAALWATDRLPAVRQLVFCAPALGQQRRRHDPDALRELRGRTGERRQPLSLDDADYTSLPGYGAFMANDHLMLRQVTDATLATMVALEDRYLTGDRPRPLPVTLARPAVDPIIDLDAAQAVLRSLCADPFQIREFDTDRHYVEFSAARTAYWDWLTELVTATEPKSHP